VRRKTKRTKIYKIPLMVHDGGYQVPVTKQVTLFAFASYPALQTREAVDPYVVFVNVNFPLSTVSEEPQSVISFTIK
jgi:hypothetical protein